MTPRPEPVARHAAAKRETISSFRAFAEGRSIPKWPVEIFLEVSNVCDLKCAMCVVFSALNEHRLHLVGAEERGFLELGPTLEALDDVLTHALNVHCVGYGEPTIHPGFREIVAAVQRYEVLADFFTNGMHLSEETCRYLVEARVAKVTVSFSGASREEYENVYLGGKFEQVLAGISRLRRLRDERRSSFPIIEINSLSFQHHVDSLDRFIDLMADHGAEVIHLKRLIPHGTIPQLFSHTAVLRPEVEGVILERAHRRARERGILLSTEQFEMALARDAAEEERVRFSQVPDYPRWMPERLDERVPLAEWPRLGRDVVPTRPAEDPRLPRRNLLKLMPEEAERQLALDLPGGTPEPFYCFEPFKTMFVRRNGLVKGCCFAAPTIALGDLATESGSAIWNGAAFGLVREGILDNRYSRELCQHCLEQQTGPRHHWVDNLVGTYLRWYEEGFGASLLGDAVPRRPELGTNTEIARRHLASRGGAGGSVPMVESHGREGSGAGWPELREELLAAKREGASALVEGNLDGLFAGMLNGWAWWPARPDARLELELFCDGERLGTVICDEYRGDLDVAGKGDGRCAFTFWLPPALHDGRRRSFVAQLEELPELWRCVRPFPEGPARSDG